MGRLLRFRRIKHAWPDEPLRLDVSLRRSWLDRLSTSQFTMLVLLGCGIIVSFVFGATDLQARRHVQKVAQQAVTYVEAWWRQVPQKQHAQVNRPTPMRDVGESDRDRQLNVSSLRCHPSYSGCLPTNGDVDCLGGKGTGPYFTGRVLVTGYDEYGLDGDGDGIGCE